MEGGATVGFFKTKVVNETPFPIDLKVDGGDSLLSAPLQANETQNVKHRLILKKGRKRSSPNWKIWVEIDNHDHHYFVDQMRLHPSDDVMKMTVLVFRFDPMSDVVGVPKLVALGVEETLIDRFFTSRLKLEWRKKTLINLPRMGTTTAVREESRGIMEIEHQNIPFYH